MNKHDEPAKPARVGWVALPVVLFATLAVLFAVSLKSGDPSRLPSALIGKPVPAFAFTPIDGLGSVGPATNGFDQAAVAKGRVSVVNFWASWCGPCVEEHAQLVALKAQPGLQVVGVNVKDDPGAAKQFLARYGNPYEMIGADRVGRGSIEWGVYGTPETFIINGAGKITFKFVGPITAAALSEKILPAIEAARKL
jgi:cytochrome c biogenesis protein CcmG, thiol:disulfide interchange protein DsbE